MGSRRSKVLNISHLFFTKDTLVLGGANTDHLRYLRALFLYFEAVSGLKINFAKFVLVPVGCVDNVDSLAGILGYGFPRYLLFHCEVARVLWNAIFSRFSLSWVMSFRVVDLFACW